MIEIAHFPLNSKKMAENMSNKVFYVVKKSIKDTKWLRPKSKKQMLKQVTTLQQKSNDCMVRYHKLIG